MFALKTITFVAMLMGLSQAAPAVTARQDIQLLLLCNDANQGDCLDFQTTPNVCSNIPGEWNNNVSSLSTYSDKKVCTFYKNANCDNSAGSVALAGTQNKLPAGFDNKLSSLICHVCFLPEGCA